MKKEFFLTTVPQLQKGAIVCGLGFLLYLAAAVLVPDLSGWVALVFAGVSLYVFWSLVLCAGREKGFVTYSLAWGQGGGDADAVRLCRAVRKGMAGPVKGKRNRRRTKSGAGFL